MESSILTLTAKVITSEELLNHWLGHRSLTRKVIEAFPEKDLFEYSVGPMRTFAEIVQELLAIAAPGIKEIAGYPSQQLKEHIEEANSKSNILKLWDESTEQITALWTKIAEERFHDKIAAFGQYEGTIWSTIFYYIENEIHHRGQGYVYLRGLGITPPPFYDRCL